MKQIGRVLLILIVLLTLGCFYYLFKSKQEANWQFLIENQVGAKSVLNIGKNLTFDDNSVYFSDGKNAIYSLSQKNGQVNWISKLYDHTPFQITQDGTSLYVASFDSHIYKLNKKNGYIIWSFAIPNQFWPDTEVAFDENDDFVFFADRAGFLYALDKNTGREVWKKEFVTIDNSKIFKEGSIHFGFLSQKDNELIVDHYPSKIVYTINKSNGVVTSQIKSSLDIRLKKPQYSFSFDDYGLEIKRNVINQPVFNLFDKNKTLLWSYQTKRKINLKEIYQYKNRIYYLDIDRKILSSILIKPAQSPESHDFRQTNFGVNENFSIHEPYKVNSNPQVGYQLKKIDWRLIIKEKIDYLQYFLSHFKQLYKFSISQEEKLNYIEFSLQHQDNFYDNKFTQVKVNGLFINQSTQEKIKTNGFYYDKNTWKLRVKLDAGEWKYAIKIKTPFLSKTFTDIIEIEKNSSPSLKIDNDQIFLGDNNFYPLGIQDSIKDLSRDGNPLNKMGYALSAVPTKASKEYRYLPFTDYLDIYKNEAGFNIFRYGPDNWAPSIWSNLDNFQQFAMDINGNYQGDYILKEAQRRQYKIMMSIFSFYPPYSSQESFEKQKNKKVLKQYLDYVIARYAVLVDIWELANEALPPLKWQNFISDYLYAHDPYHHPITTSLEETELNNSDLLSIYYYLEVPKSNRDLVNKINDLNSKNEWHKAKIISEFGFKGANYFSNSLDWMRKCAWIFAFQKTGVIFWNTGYGFMSNPAGNGNTYVGPQERFSLKILKDFLPSMGVMANKFKITDQDQLAVYELESDKYHLFYLLNFDSDQKLTVFSTIIKRNGLLIILDPKTGKILTKNKVNQGQSQIHLPVFQDDLAIKIIYE